MCGVFLAYNRHVTSGRSEVYGIIGDPIDHSMSPAIQNAAFQSTRIDAVYVPFCVKKSDLESAIEGMRALGIKGFNVTAPHKVEVRRYLDKLDRSADEIGSVNTVANRDKSLCGYNTDGIGALRALEEVGAQLNNRSILLFGAGGASRALAYTFASSARTIRIVNRTLLKARQLQRRLQKRFKLEVAVAGLAGASIKRFVEEADIIVNASSMGQNGRFDPPVQRNWLRHGQFVLDIVYSPTQTKLLKIAQAAGATAVNGLRMLVNQGACSFEIWTGRSAPVAVMHDVVRQKVLV
jgi:shikimate dehydrogenase